MSARQKRGLAIDGVLLLDKPLGPSSNDALQKVRWLLNAQKAGHAGTLDPLATGLLPIAFGQATKFLQDGLDADKTYIAKVQLGVRTTTADAEGEVLATHPVTVTAQQVQQCVAQFVGEIEQLPPMHSALKKDGKALYEYARQGIEVERAPRRITIHAIEIVELTLPTLVIKVRCSKGTYIRTLADDIGQALGCGAHLAALRRTQVGHLSLDQAVTLEQLQAQSPRPTTRGVDKNAPDVAVAVAYTPSLDWCQQYIQPIDHMIQTLPRVDLDAAQARKLLHGQQLLWPDDAPEQRLRCYDPQGALVGVAAPKQGWLTAERLIASSDSASSDTAEN